MGSLVQDLGYGLRMFARSRGFTTIALITLVLGVGANSALFTEMKDFLGGRTSSRTRIDSCGSGEPGPTWSPVTSAAHVLSSQFYGVSPRDPVIFSVSIVLLAGRGR